MGCIKSKPGLSQEDLEFLKSNTRYDDYTIKEYSDFNLNFKELVFEFDIEDKVKNRLAQLRLLKVCGEAIRVYNWRRKRELYIDDELCSAWNDWILEALLVIRRKLKVNYGTD